MESRQWNYQLGQNPCIGFLLNEPRRMTIYYGIMDILVLFSAFRESYRFRMALLLRFSMSVSLLSFVNNNISQYSSCTDRYRRVLQPDHQRLRSDLHQLAGLLCLRL